MKEYVFRTTISQDVEVVTRADTLNEAFEKVFKNEFYRVTPKDSPVMQTDLARFIEKKEILNCDSEQLN